ncbi:MAG: hypothetical protein M1500_02615 [Candidatus Marsarchaeota archaeon]|nr:hypothetical protein [Candidatus Marsarchaeota archaeon]
MKYAKLLFILLLVGTIDAAYLVVVHFSPAALYCPSGNSLIDCASVVQSQYSVVLGVPLAVLGLIWTVVALVLFLKIGREKMPFAVNVWGLLGLVGVFYSVVSMIALGKACLYCSALDILIFASILTSYIGR